MDSDFEYASCNDCPQRESSGIKLETINKRSFNFIVKYLYCSLVKERYGVVLSLAHINHLRCDK